MPAIAHMSSRLKLLIAVITALSAQIVLARPTDDHNRVLARRKADFHLPSFTPARSPRRLQRRNLIKAASSAVATAASHVDWRGVGNTAHRALRSASVRSAPSRLGSQDSLFSAVSHHVHRVKQLARSHSAGGRIDATPHPNKVVRYGDMERLLQQHRAPTARQNAEAVQADLVKAYGGKPPKKGVFEAWNAPRFTNTEKLQNWHRSHHNAMIWGGVASVGAIGASAGAYGISSSPQAKTWVKDHEPQKVKDAIARVESRTGHKPAPAPAPAPQPSPQTAQTDPPVIKQQLGSGTGSAPGPGPGSAPSGPPSSPPGPDSPSKPGPDPPSSPPAKSPPPDSAPPADSGSPSPNPGAESAFLRASSPMMPNRLPSNPMSSPSMPASSFK